MEDIEFKKNLRREIYSLRRELREDISEIRAKAKTDILLPTYAIDRMRKVEAYMKKKSVAIMTERELLRTYRKLRHIRDLKTSTLSGAEKVVSNLVSVVPQIRELSDTQIKKLWSAYDKLVEQSRALSGYKYTVVNVLADVISKKRISVDDLASRVEEIYLLATGGDKNAIKRTDKTTKLLIQSFKHLL